MAEHCRPAHGSIRTDLTAPHGVVLVIEKERSLEGGDLERQHRQDIARIAVRRGASETPSGGLCVTAGRGDR